MRLLNRLLWRASSQWQIIGAAFGSFIGLILLLISLQFFWDISYLTGEKGRGDDRFVIINKKVNLFNTLGVKSNFSNEEIEDLKNQDFVISVGNFTSNRFRVSASSGMLGFYTELFFESLPDRFLDVDVPGWKWEEGQPDIPIIISKDYLALYNFGFAPSQGLPQFTPSTIRKVTMDITVRGQGRRQTFQGKIAGFSDRINSILIPQEFMDWANKNFGESKKVESSRVILEVTNPYSKNLEDYLEENNYEVSSGRLIGGRVGTLVKLVVFILGIIGLVIVLLSALIFILNFQLIISRAGESIRLLLQLGYKHGQISNLLTKHLISLFGIVIGGTVIFFLLWRLLHINWFEKQGFDLPFGPHWMVAVVAVLFCLTFILINRRNIRRNVLALFR